jgi:acyl-coenzyme A thioesterase PaaI-like protein
MPLKRPTSEVDWRTTTHGYRINVYSHDASETLILKRKPMNHSLSLQDQFAPHNACFGCGPANTKGLRIKSMVADDKHVVATWTPEAHHEAFPGVLNGGIVGSLLDCHSNWTAAYFLMQRSGTATPPCTVTADYSIKLLRPTPTHGPVTLTAWVKEISDDRAVIEAKLEAGGKVCDTCVGTFVAVKPGHPAYHRW